MFEGKRFFPETGTPIWKMARSSVVFAVWLPEPLTVATWIVKLLLVAFNGIPASKVMCLGAAQFRSNTGWGQALFPYHVVGLSSGHAKKRREGRHVALDAARKPLTQRNSDRDNEGP